MDLTDVGPDTLPIADLTSTLPRPPGNNPSKLQPIVENAANDSSRPSISHRSQCHQTSASWHPTPARSEPSTLVTSRTYSFRARYSWAHYSVPKSVTKCRKTSKNVRKRRKQSEMYPKRQKMSGKRRKTSKCIRKHRKPSEMDPKRHKISPNISKPSENVPKSANHPKTSKNIEKHRKMSKNVENSQKMSVKRREMYPNVPAG